MVAQRDERLAKRYQKKVLSVGVVRQTQNAYGAYERTNDRASYLSFNFFHSLIIFRSCLECSQLLFIGIPDFYQILIDASIVHFRASFVLIFENGKKVMHDITIGR